MLQRLRLCFGWGRPGGGEVGGQHVGWGHHWHQTQSGSILLHCPKTRCACFGSTPGGSSPVMM